MIQGSVSIVGAGPGDPELLTVKAVRRIQTADVILYDRLVNEEILGCGKPEALRIYCGKAPGRHSMPQEGIEKLMIKYAAAGNQVVRLKGGDPYMFGRGGEEALAVAAAGIAYEVIPGITSAIGAAASAGIPLTHRGLAASFAIVTGSRC
ncbi:uroporphyrinogen-III C-methyltransferase, partial [Paenibacillus riograndensis]